MRLISQYDISRLFQEKVENIIKDYADHYGIKIISEKPTSINTQNINFNLNQSQSSITGKPQILNNIAATEITENQRNINNTSNIDLNGSQNLDLNGNSIYLIFFLLKIKLYFLNLTHLEKENIHNYSSKEDSRDKDKKKRKR